MTTALEEPPGRTGASSAHAADRLRRFAAAMRVSFTWFGVRKTLTPQQKEQAAESFGAEGTFLSAGKKLIDTKDPTFKAVTSVRGRIIAYWRGISLPFPEPGIRLIRQDDVGHVNERLTELRHDLADAVTSLGHVFEDLKDAARRRLGRLFNPADYPTSLQGLFEVSWDYRNQEIRIEWVNPLSGGRAIVHINAVIVGNAHYPAVGAGIDWTSGDPGRRYQGLRSPVMSPGEGQTGNVD